MIVLGVGRRIGVGFVRHVNVLLRSCRGGGRGGFWLFVYLEKENANILNQVNKHFSRYPHYFKRVQFLWGKFLTPRLTLIVISLMNYIPLLKVKHAKSKIIKK